jgi:hypothetical protein
MLLLPPVEPPLEKPPAPPNPFPPVCGDELGSSEEQLVLAAPASNAPVVTSAMRTQLLTSAICGNGSTLVPLAQAAEICAPAQPGFEARLLMSFRQRHLRQAPLGRLDLGVSQALPNPHAGVANYSTLQGCRGASGGKARMLSRYGVERSRATV